MGQRGTTVRRRDVLAAGLALPLSIVAGPLAGAAAKRPGLTLLPGTILLGPQATLNGDQLTFQVHLVAPSPGLGAFEFQTLYVDNKAVTTTFSPDLQYVTGEQQFAVTAGPVPPLKGNVSLILIAGYAGEGGEREVATPPTNVSIVAATAFARSRRPWPR